MDIKQLKNFIINCKIEKIIDLLSFKQFEELIYIKNN